MSTLTKICVVVLVVLLLLACPVFIHQAVSPVNWKDAYTGEQRRRLAAEVQAKNQKLGAQVWQRRYETAKSRVNDGALQFEKALAGKEVEIARLTQQYAGCSGKMEELTALLKATELSRDRQINLSETLLTQLDAKRAEAVTLGKQIREAQQSINEYLAKIERLIASEKVLKEQVAQKKIENDDLRRQLEVGGIQVAGTSEAPAARPPKIDATVTAVRGDVASLNIGSASGVKKDMEFIIYRGADFVAHLRIAEVFDSSSAGIIVDKTREVKVNDKATTSLE